MLRELHIRPNAKYVNGTVYGLVDRETISLPL